MRLMNEEKSSGKRDAILIALLVVFGLSIVGIIGVVAFRLGQSQPGIIPPPTGEPIIILSPTPETAPSPTLTPPDTLKPTTSPANESDADKIRKVLANKYSKNTEETEISVSKNTGTHATGSVRFAGEMGGGMWLAYKDGENWIVTYDGQGTIPCSAVDPYNFPTDIAPECWDETTSSLITR